MTRIVREPPDLPLLEDGSKVGGWWRDADQPGRILCEVCPRGCQLKPGDRGFCFVRENRDGQMVLSTYGKSTGFCIDPIEKKPLNHFYPGTSVLSFGTAGCNLGCKFCQNWNISKSREVKQLSEHASPATVANAAAQLGCKSVAFTYNDPVIFAEYAIDTARACHDRGIKTVAVTAGYITPAARGAFYEVMDAANVDLKAFTEQFYHKLTLSHLEPVLDTLKWLRTDTDVWFEITNLIIPQANDSEDELRRLCDWVLDNLGDDVPLHFSAFHPDFRMTDRPPTPHETLLLAYDIAYRTGLKYAYVGNVNDAQHHSTYCPGCKRLLIERDWYDLGVYQLKDNRCSFCDTEIAGRFEAAPGNWGRKRLPVRIAQFAVAPPPRHAPASSHTLPKSTEQKMTDSKHSPRVPGDGSQPPVLTDEQRQIVLKAAAEVVVAEVQRRSPQIPDPRLGGAADFPLLGAFVTLTRQGQLRSCCGIFGGVSPLGEAVCRAAERTAKEDYRFPPISPEELEHLDVDVWLLFGDQPLEGTAEERIAGVEIGRHGLRIEGRQKAGLLLPSVATQHHLDAEGFLGQVCHKAGLPPTAWKEPDIRLMTFEGVSIESPLKAVVRTETPAETPPFSPAEVERLGAGCRQNVLAVAQGATPYAYLPGCPDGTVSGAAMTARVGGGEPFTAAKLAFRPGLPLQSTLFSLAESLGGALRNQGYYVDPAQLHVGIAILSDPTMHGTVERPDLAGIHPQRRCVLVMEGNKSAWRFDPAKSAEELLAAAAEAVRVTRPEAASVLSLQTLSTDATFEVTNVPRPNRGPATRPPAVAGTFYPRDPAEIARQLDEMFTNGKEQKQPWPAALVPHAGWRYSGRIAAQVLRQLEIPQTVIIFAPKHTRPGMEWAVAPHEVWQLPGQSLESDPELAARLAEAIDGLALDAQAHVGEHAIEVQLPLLARLAPESRVVGITIGGGTLDQCQAFAAGLARVVKEMEQPPLLLVSSDMNHYAGDAENRRLDAIALDALETLDPAHLYNTVTSEKISMCGMRPAVIVMETLRQLDRLKQCRRVAYATSADASGDKTQVVGYAGVLLG